ncbi:hypothetical protein ACN38_g3680 [Penicillium nordicum]|uniref:Uncharacterized protein n=1 Tax=Penicillium nordicum TaxID=229535 RepID=A0A0M8P599_9EURO|nr:hypothetical protein ACN38_g3680 [Penicillium nordicum]
MYCLLGICLPVNRKSGHVPGYIFSFRKVNNNTSCCRWKKKLFQFFFPELQLINLHVISDAKEGHPHLKNRTMDP